MIETETRSGLGTITLARPEKRNALDPAGLDALVGAVEAATEPVVFLRGAGSAFCAGADLEVVNALDGEDAAEFARRGQRATRAIEEAESVVIAGIDGPARGGGVELALACDIRLATPRATFGEPGVANGLFGAWGGTVRLPQVCGLGDAMDLSLSGRVIDAEEALRIGLVSRIVEEPERVARGIAAHDPDSLRIVKRRLRDTSEAGLQEEAEAAAFASLLSRDPESGD
ncbi:enoyl-CoA hydratase/isomerase family protein [Natronorarus salvus]|uniref:enoyl-CoA hydratase/isomerase family protein n=1 Tax=Natronorarus salvus TaxID=3117733 RepID=UPI002F268F0E